MEGTLEWCNKLLDGLNIEYPDSDFGVCNWLPSGTQCENGFRYGN